MGGLLVYSLSAAYIASAELGPSGFVKDPRER